MGTTALQPVICARKSAPPATAFQLRIAPAAKKTITNLTSHKISRNLPVSENAPQNSTSKWRPRRTSACYARLAVLYAPPSRDARFARGATSCSPAWLSRPAQKSAPPTLKHGGAKFWNQLARHCAYQIQGVPPGFLMW